MNRWKKEVMTAFISCFCLALILANPSHALDRSTTGGSVKPAAPPVLTEADHAALKQRVSILRNSADALERQLDTIGRTSPSECNNCWKNLHEGIILLRTHVLTFTDQMSSLKRRNLVQADWVALNKTAGNDLRTFSYKLENIRKKYEVVLKNPGRSNLQSEANTLDAKREDIKAKRDDVESKYKAAEQGGSSDYQILISIVKTINEELGIFNKGMN